MNVTKIQLQNGYKLSFYAFKVEVYLQMVIECFLRMQFTNI